MELELLKAVVMLSAPSWEQPSPDDADGQATPGGFIGRTLRRIGRVFGSPSGLGR
jgi:hypothetical protein